MGELIKRDRSAKNLSILLVPFHVFHIHYVYLRNSFCPPLVAPLLIHYGWHHFFLNFTFLLNLKMHTHYTVSNGYRGRIYGPSSQKNGPLSYRNQLHIFNFDNLFLLNFPIFLNIYIIYQMRIFREFYISCSSFSSCS